MQSIEIAIVLLTIVWLVFFGIFLYGAIRHKKIGTNTMWFGCIGINVFNVILQILNVVRLAMK